MAYQGLSKHVRKIVLGKLDRNVKFFRINEAKEEHFTQLNYNKLKKRKIYRKNIVNKWHVILFLTKNPVLLMYRKN